jgi:hypothetical protein
MVTTVTGKPLNRNHVIMPASCCAHEHASNTTYDAVYAECIICCASGFVCITDI